MNTLYAGRDHARALVAAFEDRLGAVTELGITSRPWASATFAGTRHCLSFVVDGCEKVERFQRDMVDAELPLHRAFVADIVVAPAVGLPGGRTRLTVEALVIDEA